MDVAWIDIDAAEVYARTVIELECALLGLRKRGMELHSVNLRRGDAAILIQAISIEHIVSIRLVNGDVIVFHVALAEE